MSGNDRMAVMAPQHPRSLLGSDDGGPSGGNLTVSGLSAWNGQAQALFDVCLTVRSHEFVAILGRNGAGKSTLLRALAGVHPHAEGSVVLDGQGLLGSSPDAIARRGISFVRQGGKLFETLSIRDNLLLGRRLARLRERRDIPPLELAWDWFPVLETMQDLKAAYLSGGQRQMLVLATALLSDPVLLLLDEPSAGLAPVVAETIFQTIGRLREKGLSVLIVEQHPSWLVGVTTRAVLLETGRVVREGDIEELIES